MVLVCWVLDTRLLSADGAFAALANLCFINVLMWCVLNIVTKQSMQSAVSFDWVKQLKSWHAWRAVGLFQCVWPTRIADRV